MVAKMHPDAFAVKPIQRIWKEGWTGVQEIGGGNCVEGKNAQTSARTAPNFHTLRVPSANRCIMSQFMSQHGCDINVQNLSSIFEMCWRIYGRFGFLHSISSLWLQRASPRPRLWWILRPWTLPWSICTLIKPTTVFSSCYGSPAKNPGLLL